MASTKDISIGIFEAINYQIKELQDMVDNTRNYLYYLQKTGKNPAIQADCKDVLGTMEWQIKDLKEEKKFYLEYFGFTKEDFKGKLYYDERTKTQQPKYLNLDKEFTVNEDGTKTYWFLPTEEQMEAELKKIEKEATDPKGEWDEKARATFKEKMGMTVEEWRATCVTRF